MELKNTITEFLNTIEGMNNRLDHTEEQTRKLENRVEEVTQIELKQRERETEHCFLGFFKEDSLRGQ